MHVWNAAGPRVSLLLGNDKLREAPHVQQERCGALSGRDPLSLMAVDGHQFYSLETFSRI